MDMTAELQLPHATKAAPLAADQKRMPIRYWIMAALLVAFWIFEFSIYTVEMAMFPRFITRMLVSAALLLIFLGWLLTNRHLLWRDRLLMLGLLIFGTAAAIFLADAQSQAVVVLVGLPRLITAWVLSLMITHHLTPTLQRLSLCAAAMLVLGYYDLVRWDGLDGAQRAKLSWRWTSTPEQEFLATSANRAVGNALRGVPSTPTRGVSEGPEAPKPWTLQPGDWPDFLSDHRDGGLPDLALTGDWTRQPPPLVWRRRVGPGWSSMIVVDGHLVTQEQRGEADAIVCYDAETGDERWVHTDNDRFDEPLSGPGPRSTPAFSDGRIFAIGGRGRLNCLDAPTGKVLWTLDGAGEVGQWGLATAPLATDDLVVVFGGKKSKVSLGAFHADRPEVAWSQAAGDASYSSPQLVVLGGQRQILMIDNWGLHSLAVESGEKLWEHRSDGGPADPMLQSHIISDHELIIPWNSGIARLIVERKDGEWTVSRKWETTALKPGFNDFVTNEGHIFGLDDGILCCLDAATGERLWKKGRFGHGQMLLAASPPRLVVVDESGEVVLLDANPKHYEELGRFKALDDKTWNHPVLAHGCLFLRNAAEMACYRLAAE